MMATGRRERGGMLSLLLSVLAVGLLAYFVLRANSGSKPGSGAGTDALGGEAAAVSCTQQAQQLIAKTGGQGPEYKAGYEALPSNCRGLLPPPDALAPRPLPEN